MSRMLVSPTFSLLGGLAAVLAVGCSGGAPGEPVGTSSEAITPTYGVDYSFARPSPSSIRAAGFTFVARYLSNEPAKNLSASEASELEAAGLTIVCNWEDSATNALSGYSQGVADARTAAAQALSVGQPATRPIYFSVDFDANSSQIGTIESYFEGVASVIGLSRTGVYGGYYVVNSLFNAGKVQWGWQTYAWSYGSWDSRAQFRQIENGIDGDQEDEDEAVVGDFGQWPIAPPPPAPTRGWLDSVSCDQLAGWAQDPNSPTTSIPVDIYLDGPAGSGTGIGRFSAANPRSDLCTAIGSCNHGFTIQPPSSLYDGHAHTIYAYGIAVTSGAPNSMLAGAPKTLQCATALTGNFNGTGYTEVLQFRDDWQTLPTCGRWGSDWSCADRAATYLGGLGAGNGGTAIYAGATPLVGDANGDGRDDFLQFKDTWASIPVCFSTAHGWACENLKADYVGGLGAGNGGTGIYPGATPLTGDVNGDGLVDVIQYNPGWQGFPVCFSTEHGWSCENLEATYVGGIGAGNTNSGVYGETFGKGTSVLVADVNGDGKADIVQYNAGWASIPVCFSTGHGWSCENLKADYVGGIGAGNAGTGIDGATTVKMADVNGDGKSDLVQFNPGWQSIPVCFSTGHGWSCENLKADYIGGLGAGNSGSGIYGSLYGASTILVADINGDGNADVVQYSSGWQSIPVCFSTGHGWSCENMKADYLAGGGGAGNAGTAIYPYGVPLTGTFKGGKASGIVQIDPDSGWTTLPICTTGSSGWICSNTSAAVY
jgi:Domain of unknown function (DUF1906)